jgi:hypothetical protein
MGVGYKDLALKPYEFARIESTKIREKRATAASWRRKASWAVSVGTAMIRNG